MALPWAGIFGGLKGLLLHATCVQGNNTGQGYGLGWVVNENFCHSSVCQVLPRQNGWVSGQDGGTSQIKVKPTHVPDHHCHTVVNLGSF